MLLVLSLLQLGKVFFFVINPYCNFASSIPDGVIEIFH